MQNPETTATESPVGTTPGTDPAQMPPLSKIERMRAELEAMRITHVPPANMGEPLIKMNGTIVATRQNLMVLSGPSKGGKSAIVSLLCAGSLAGPNGYDGCPAIQIAPNTDNHAVLHFDTEQCRALHHSNQNNAILKRAGLAKTPEHFWSLNLLDKNHEDCKKEVIKMFEFSLAEYGGVHLAIVDGVADFITKVNDEDEATKIVAFFREQAVKYNTTVILVIHQNPGGEKERGHLGSELQRKCESMLVITKTNEVSTLKAKFLRQGNIKQFGSINYQFNTDENYHTFAHSRHAAVKQLEIEELAKLVFVKRRASGEASKEIERIKGVKKRQADELLKEMVHANLLDCLKKGSSVIYWLRNSEKTM
ncbi:MAG: AAA family ATPase [Chitinophagales bacterium]|nr:AAA family ATPase [Chitinophagales bacterium]